MYFSYLFLIVGLFLLSVMMNSVILFIFGVLVGLGYGMFMLNG